MFYLHVSTPCACNAYEGQKRALHPLEEPMVVVLHVDAGHGALVLCKNNQCCHPLSHLSSPPKGLWYSVSHELWKEGKREAYLRKIQYYTSRDGWESWKTHFIGRRELFSSSGGKFQERLEFSWNKLILHFSEQGLISVLETFTIQGCNLASSLYCKVWCRITHWACEAQHQVCNMQDLCVRLGGPRRNASSSV